MNYQNKISLIYQNKIHLTYSNNKKKPKTLVYLHYWEKKEEELLPSLWPFFFEGQIKKSTNANVSIKKKKKKTRNHNIARLVVID